MLCNPFSRNDGTKMRDHSSIPEVAILSLHLQAIATLPSSLAGAMILLPGLLEQAKRKSW